MIRFLSVTNLAVIDRLELEFAPGFNVLTGETGAGKSILVGAVGLLVGGRASAELVRTGEETAAVQAVFERPDGGEVIVRREVSSQGRSRAFVDGALVTSTALRDAAGSLVDLHGQHEHQVLLDPAAHLDLLDEFAGLTAERERVASAFRAWQLVRDERARLAAAEQQKVSRVEFLVFQLCEIDKAAPRADEDQELMTTRQVLANADRLQRLCADAYTALYEGDEAALPALGTVWKKVGELAALDATFVPYVEARDAVKSQLEDLAFFLRLTSGVSCTTSSTQPNARPSSTRIWRLPPQPTGAWPAISRPGVARRRRNSARPSKGRWPIWRWRRPAARFGSPKTVMAGKRPGPSEVWTRRSSTFRPTPERTSNRWRELRPAANCHGSCWR